MRLRRIAFWSGFSLLALIVLAISWLWVADLGTFKPQIERWASEKTGRQVAIDGELHIDLTRHASVVAENVRMQNAGWAEQADMITIGRIELRLDLGSIFKGPIIVELIDLDDAEFFLTKPVDGDANWNIIKKSEEDEEEEKKETRGIVFKQIDIDRVHIVYATPQRTAPIDAYIEFLDQRHRDDDFLELSLEGTLGERQVKFKSETGTWAAVLSGKDIHYDLVAELDTFEFRSNGWIDDVMQPRRPSLSFTATAPDIDDLTRLLNMGEEGSGDIDLTGSLTPHAQGPLVLDVKGGFGRAEVEVSGAFSDLQDLEEIDIDLLMSGPDIRPILDLFGIDQIRESPYMIDLDAQRSGDTLVIEKADIVFGEAKFGLAARMPNFPSVDDSVISLRIDGPDIERFRHVFNLPGAAKGPFSLGFTIDVADDGIEILNLDIETSLGEIRANGSLGDAPEYFGSTLNFRLTSEDLAKFGGAYGIRRLPDVPLVVSGSVEYGPDGIRSVDSLTVVVNEVLAKIDGLIKPVKGLFGSDFEFELDGPSLAELIGAFGANTGVPVQPYTFDGQLQIRDDGYRFRGVTGKVGSSDIEIDGLLVPRRGIIGSRFNFVARGAAFTEIIDEIGDLEVRPGPYELSGSVNFESDRIDFDGVELNRATGKVDLDFELGMPISRRWANLDIRASGPNVQSLIKGFDNFEANEAPFLIDVEGTLRDTTWSFDTLDINVGTATLSAQGALEFVGEAAATQFKLGINIPKLGALGALNGRRMRAHGFTLNADVTGGGGVMEIDDLVATLGPSDINGNIRLRTGEVPHLDIDIESDAIVFAPLLEEREQEYDPTPEFDDGRLIPDITIPFEAMAKLNASIEVDIGELHRDSLHIRDIVLRAKLQDGAVEVSKAGFQARSGAVVARAWIGPQDGNGYASVELVARDLAFGIADINSDLAMTGDIEINLASTGTNLRSLLGNANGIFFANTRGGRLVNNRVMHALYGDMLDEILGTINPFRKSEKYTNFACIILPLEIKNGVVTSHPSSLVSTDKIRIVLKSQINLKSESLEMNVRTTPKKGISISAGEIVNPYVKVVGTLASPRLAVDAEGILLSGGAAVATGGLSILAKAAWSRLSRAKDPCAETASEGLESLGARFSDLTVVITEPEPATEPVE